MRSRRYSQEVHPYCCNVVNGQPCLILTSIPIILFLPNEELVFLSFPTLGIFRKVILESVGKIQHSLKKKKSTLICTFHHLLYYILPI